MTLRVGSVLHGFCSGAFGRDSYSDKRVEAIGADWLVAREENGSVVIARKPQDVESSDDWLDAIERCGRKT